MVRTAAQRARTLTTTEAAVLALLAINGERSGYDLLKQAAKSIGHVWTPARSQLYAVLPRLVDTGLAERRSVVQQQRPDKHLYLITEQGRARLQEWLETVEPGALESFYLRVFVGGLMPVEALVAHIEQFKLDLGERLATYRAIEPTNSRQGHDFFHFFMLRLGIEQTELALRWADQVIAELEETGR